MKSPPDADGPISGVTTNVQVYSLHDGPGLRTIVFLKGCPLKCQWCCNPECISRVPEIEFYKSRCVKCGACLKACPHDAINPDLEVKAGFKIDKERCTGCGDCVDVCPTEALKMVGNAVTVDEVMEKVLKDKSFYLISRGGLTVSGGEPLHQPRFTYELLKRAHNNNIDTAIETCGYAPWKNYEKILPYLDLVLFDIKHMDSEKHKQMTGMSNKLILSNLKKISQSGIPLIIRLPLIPDFNTDPDNIAKTAQFISELDNVVEVNLMPFHQLGKDKYQRLGLPYYLKELNPLESESGLERVKAIKERFEKTGLKITVGG